MTEPLAIRKATLQDTDSILRCLREAFEDYRDSYTSCAFEDTILTQQTLQNRFREMTVLVAVDELCDVVGTIAYKVEPNGEGHLRGMAVRPKLHGRGTAKKLLDQVEAELSSVKCHLVTLDTTNPLQRAIHFYEKNGFKPTGVVTAFFGMNLYKYQKEI